MAAVGGMTRMDAGSDAIDEPHGSRWLRGWASVAALAAAFLVILLFRRGQQIVCPQVWDEDGTLILREILDDGIGARLGSEIGYEVLVPRVISWLSLCTSISLYPLVSTLLAWAFSVAVLLVIARHPSRLAGGALLSLGVLLVPTDPEAFGIPLYTIWWAALLLFVAVFWDERAGHLPLRLAGTVCGGLSSPLIVLAAPVYWARACLHRHRWREWVLAGVATACAAVQLAFMRRRNMGRIPEITVDTVSTIVTKFFGHFAVGELPGLCGAVAPVGAVVCALAVFVLWRRRHEAAAWFLGYLLLGSIALSISRVPVTVIHPVLAGPRYFFFPYILLAWVLLQAACRTDGPGWARGAARAVLVLAALNSLPHFCRTHDDLDWRGHLASSVHFDRYDMPVEFDGAACRRWSLTVDGERMAAALTRDPFAAWTRGVRTYPYTTRVFIPRVERPAIVSRGDVDAGTWQSVAAADDAPRDVVALRSTGSTAARRISFTARRGVAVLYRSSESASALEVTIAEAEGQFVTTLLPSTQWSWLEFSSRQLPATFTVVIEDRGTAPGQWVEVAVAP